MASFWTFGYQDGPTVTHCGNKWFNSISVSLVPYSVAGWAGAPGSRLPLPPFRGRNPTQFVNIINGFVMARKITVLR